MKIDIELSKKNLKIWERILHGELKYEGEGILLEKLKYEGKGILPEEFEREGKECFLRNLNVKGMV